MTLFPLSMKERVFSFFNSRTNGLSVDYLLRRAIQKTGLSDWGETPFLEPLHQLVDSINREANLSQQGVFVLNQHYLRLLTNILKIVEDWKERPEISETPVQSPVFVLGYPRTGTTFLHGLLADDPASRSLQYWELLFPSPPPNPASYATNDRIRMAKFFVFFIDLLSPKLSLIHKLKPTGPEECCFIFDHLFLDNIHHLVFDVPSYIQWYDGHDPIPSYRFHKKMLQHYGRNFAFERFALKAPRHLFCLEALLTVYPDARIVWTHREPIEAVASLCSLSETARRIVSNDVDARRIGRLCVEYFERDFAAGMRAREIAAPGQILDVMYRDLVKQPQETVEKIYSHFNIPYSDAFQTNLRERLSQKKRRKLAPHRYSLEDYGLTPEIIRERLGGYYEAFGPFE